MKTLLLSNEAIQCLEAHLLGVLAKWDPHLFIGTDGAFWNLESFLTNKKDSRKFYTTLCTSLFTRDLYNYLESPKLLSGLSS